MMEQIFFSKICKLCSSEVLQKWNRFNYIEERKFVTDADNRNRAICTHCGFTTGITNQELKEIENERSI